MEPAKAPAALSGVSETMLVTLSARADDFSKGAESLLRDRWAAEVLEKLDYKRAPTPQDFAFFALVVLRAALLDAWTAEFLAASGGHATVLHLACGLDSRVARVARGPGVRWVDVDVAEVVALRRTLLPDAAEGDYSLVAASVTEEQWLLDVPADRPTLVVMEGLVAYLTEDEVRRLVVRVCDRFPSGQIVFDCVGKLFVRFQAMNKPIAQTGAVLQYAIDDERDVEAWHDKLRLRDVYRIWNLPGVERIPWVLRASLWVYSLFPWTRTAGSYMRFDF